MELSINFVFLQKRDFQYKKLTIMKKYLLILIIAIFCLPNIANAQFTRFGIGPTTTGEREMRDQNRHGRHKNKNSKIKSAKRRFLFW